MPKRTWKDVTFGEVYAEFPDGFHLEKAGGQVVLTVGGERLACNSMMEAFTILGDRVLYGR